jgi:hypothetical protein
MRIAGEWKIGKVAKSFRSSFGGDGCGAHIAAQNLRDLHVEKMRSMQGLVGCEEYTADTWRSRSLQKNLQHGRSVDDDQRVFLSARTAAAAEGRGRVGSRLARRLRISSRVGRSRACRSSRSK